MGNQVYANKMEVSCKSASGKTICASPDVCFTPPQTAATPPGVPIPYPNTGMASDTTDGSRSVKISGKEVMLKDKSYFKKSSGDEAGSAPKHGVVTSKITGKVYFNAWSMDVKVEGENVVRHLDITTGNHASKPGNVVPVPHTDEQAAAPVDSGEAEACPVCPTAGSPVNPIEGTKVLAGGEDLDFTMEGPLPLAWQRSYRSSNGRVGWFGKGWSSPFEVTLEAVPDPTGRYVDHVVYVDVFGRRVTFPHVAVGGSFHFVQEQLTLSRDRDGRFRMQSVDGVTYHFADRVGVAHRLAALVDRNDNAIRINYPDATSAVVHCSGGQVLRLAFDASRLRQVVRLPGEAGGEASVLAAYEYDARDALRGVVNRAGERMRAFDYDADGRMTHHVYAGMFEAWYAYGRVEDTVRVMRHWDNVGRSWSFDYRSYETAMTDQDGRVLVYHFDARRRWIGLTDAADRLTRFGLDRHGNLRSVVDPAEHVSETAFDDRGNPVTYRDPTGATAAVEWHPAMALPTAVTDPLNRTTRFAYDDRGNLVRRSDATGAETQFERDVRGLAVRVIDALGGTTSMQYDEQARLTRHVDCSGNETRYAYDPDGNLAAIVDALGKAVSFAYDAAGRLIARTEADGGVERYKKDLADRTTRLVDGNGSTTTFRYAPDGQLLERVNALGDSQHYRYNGARALIEVVNENGARYRLERDVLDRLVEETRFDGGRTRYAYDVAGYVVELAEAADTSQETRSRYQRDALGRLLERIRPDGRSLFRYDAAGQLVQAAAFDPRVRVDLKYDEAGRRVEERVTTPDRAFVLRHVYDALGNRLASTLPDGTTLGTLYYGSGHAHQIHIAGDPVTDLERDALHRETTRTQGRLTTVTRYDPVGRVEQKRTYAGPVVDASRVTVALPVVEREFRYDPAGRLVAAFDRGERHDYGYDAIDQLVRFDDERFAFDPAHNLVAPVDVLSGASVSPVLDNRVTACGDIRYVHDLHGRVTLKTIGSHTSIRLEWNDEHRLVRSTVDDVHGRRVTDYTYDALGRRVSKSNAFGTTWFVWDNDRLLQACGPIDQRTFIYEPDSFVPLAQAVESPDASGRKLFYFHCDQVGLPRELSTPDGRLVWEGQFAGWGGLRGARAADEAGAGAASARSLQAFGFQGEYRDDETGLHYSFMRYYDPDAARFVSPDPIGLIGGTNTYQYAPNPVTWIDPWGWTGTYIFTNGKIHYIGKGPAERFKVSQKERLGACAPTAAKHKDYGDNEMGLMVEHLLMVDYGVPGASGFDNAIGSPGKKKYEAATQARKDLARKNADDLKADFKKAGGC